MTLSLYDVTGIQRYVYCSNVLRENLGGSWLVSQALGPWLLDASTAEAGANVRWAGGGNAMVESPDVSTAKRVAQRLAQRLAQSAPGLDVACVHVDPGAAEPFPLLRQRAYEQLARAKAGRWPQVAFDGAGVTAACRSTGEPAIVRTDDGWFGPAAERRLASADSAEEALRNLFPLSPLRRDGRELPLRWTSEIDKLGATRGERSMVGVIHVDGNAMAERFRTVTTLDELATLSEQVGSAGREALVDVLEWVWESLPGLTDEEKGGFALRQIDGRRCFPVRPIVYGGDDITVVCDARISLDVAAALLGAWQRRTQPLGGAHACAGVAIVKSHYPFHRAYLLADELCRAAKTSLAEDRARCSALDWEIVWGGGVEGLAARRTRHDVADDGARLSVRPYVVAGNQPGMRGYRRWDWLRRTLVEALQADDECRTQYKRLGECLQLGASEAATHLARMRDRFGRSLPMPPNVSFDGAFAYGETPYLDGLELMDLVVPLGCWAAPTDDGGQA